MGGGHGSKEKRRGEHCVADLGPDVLALGGLGWDELGQGAL